MGWPVPGFQSRTVPSLSALASILPSGLNATAITPRRGPWRREGSTDGLAGARVPEPHRAVAVGAGQHLAIRAERHPGHVTARARISWEGTVGWPVPGFHSRTVRRRRRWLEARRRG